LCSAQKSMKNVKNVKTSLRRRARRRRAHEPEREESKGNGRPTRSQNLKYLYIRSERAVKNTNARMIEEFLPDSIF